MEHNTEHKYLWNWKSVSLFAFLVFLPNILGMINLSTPFGFKIHFFQLAIILAAAIFGPYAGLTAGLIGSINSAIIMSNPYIIIGNAILGLFAGIFIKKGINIIVAVLLAYAIQFPWLVLTDFYLVGLPIKFIQFLAIALLASNLIWAVVAHHSVKPIKSMIQ